MSTRIRFAVVAAAAALAFPTVATVHAGQARFDLTGTWQGSIKCKGVFQGAKFPAFTLTPTLKISQSGLNVGILADYPPGDTDDSYVGYANPDVKKPLEKGELAILYCGTDDVLGNEPTFDEIGRMVVSTKPPKVKATFKGTSIYSDPGISDAEVGTCKWKWTRTDANDPGIPTTCPPP